MEARAAVPDPDGYYASNLAFHAFLADHCGNEHMRQIYRSASMKLHIYRRSRLRTETDLARSNDQHRRLLAAIRAKDPDAARHEMRAHIERNKHWYSDTGQMPGADADQATRA
jgi:DNA-binding FadR family transcriptional regulator